MIVTGMHISFREKLVSAVILCALSACGTSTPDERTVSDQPIANLSTSSAASLFVSVANGEVLSDSEVQTWDDALSPIATTLFANRPVTPWSSVPDAGSADYRYVGGVELVPNGDDSNRIFGTMSATTDFDTTAITGTAQNFFSGTGDLQAGPLNFSGTFFRDNDLANEFGISGAFTGTLAGPIINGAVNINVAGDFADSATVIYGGGTGTAGTGDATASFVLTRD
jgi:hypothetical protein